MNRKIKPLDAQKLHFLAMAYVARFATSTGKLRRYLDQKVRMSEWTEENQPDIEGLVEKCCQLGLIDDEDFAERKSESLSRRGYGPARVRFTLHNSGISEKIAAKTLSKLSEDAEKVEEAAFTFARKRKFGPFGANPLSAQEYKKQMAAMIRAGHNYETVRKILALTE